MPPMPSITDGLMNPAVSLTPGQLLGTVCTLGGVECPLLSAAEAHRILDLVAADPTVTMRLISNVDELPHYTTLAESDYAARRASALDRKRDLDVLQRLGLLPGDTRRARHLYTLLLDSISTPDGICAYDTPNWEGCPHARSGAYAAIRERGWHAIVYLRPQAEKDEARRLSAARISGDECLFVRPHHFMCMACWYAGGEGAQGPRPEDTIFEILERIRRDPDVPVTLVEGCCEACHCCDGFDPRTTRCVHACGLIRDYKKDLDVLQKLGLLPGDTLPAREFITRLFDRIRSTREICGYGDGVVRAEEWKICGGPEGNPGYEKTRRTGFWRV